MSKNEKYRDRKHMLLLYPEDATHMEALEKIRQSYDYAAVLHDRDYWTEEDEKKDSKHVAGELKKAHYHVVIRTSNPTWSSALCKELGIAENYCEKPRGFESALQYLIHYNDIDKATYDIDEVFGPLKVKLVESINKTEKSEGEKVVELIAFIRDYDGPLKITDFAEYCAKNGYWSEFRRSGAIFCKIIEEHNVPYRIDTHRVDSGAFQDARDQARFEGVVLGHQEAKKNK